MTLVIASAVSDGVLLGGDTLISIEDGKVATLSKIPGGKVFAIGNRFGVVTYGTYAGQTPVPQTMATLTVDRGESTASFASRLLGIFEQPRAGNTLRAIIAGVDGDIFRIIEAPGPHEQAVQKLRTGVEVGFWSGSLWGEDPTKLPSWPAGRSPRELAGEMTVNTAREFFGSLMRAAAAAQPRRVGPEMDAVIVAKEGVERIACAQPCTCRSLEVGSHQ